METTDKLSPELQEAKNEIDNYYKSNPLVNLPFVTAMSSFLAYATEFRYMEFMNIVDEGDLIGQYDNVMATLHHSTAWLYSHCKQSNINPTIPDDNQHNASKDLYELVKKYNKFFLAFTCAENDILELELKGSTIQLTENFYTHIEFEIYNMLIALQKPDEDIYASVDILDDPIDDIVDSIKFKKNKLHYPLNPKLVADVNVYFTPTNNDTFFLSKNWQFIGYTMDEFRLVFESLIALAHIHKTAYDISCDSILNDIHYFHSFYMPTCNELLNRIVRYSGVSKEIVQRIFDDITYGNINNPKPNLVLQPLIKLNSNYYAITSSIWYYLHSEWDMNALINCLPAQKDIYNEFAKEKYVILSDKFNNVLSQKEMNILRQGVDSLPDNYIVIVSHSEKACLLVDLKWFILPTSIGDKIQRSEEIQIAISQMQNYKHDFAEKHPLLLEKLNIDTSYRIEGVVAPENWIGFGNIHTPEVPIIQVYHLIDKLEETDSLQDTIDWLIQRKYMPKIGQQFSVSDKEINIGNWTLQWYTVKHLQQGRFYPL